jgi:hypothetical protein
VLGDLLYHLCHRYYLCFLGLWQIYRHDHLFDDAAREEALLLAHLLPKVVHRHQPQSLDFLLQADRQQVYFHRVDVYRDPCYKGHDLFFLDESRYFHQPLAHLSWQAVQIQIQD